MDLIEDMLRAEFTGTKLPRLAPDELLAMVAEAPPRRAYLPEAAAGVFLVAYSAYSIQRHHRMQSGGFDLGIFQQIVRAYASGHAPVVELKAPGFDALGDHFSPILALLAPAYRLPPTAETLLVAQAFLVALSIVPIGRAATAELGAARGAAVSVAYGLSWGLLGAVTFDFHEICFAVPLLAFSLNRLLAKRWVAAAAWAIPLVAVKEDLPLTVAAVGGCLVLRGQRRLGAGLVGGGLVATVVLMLWVLPAFHPDHSYPYADQLVGSTHGWGVGTKLGTLALLLAPSLFVAVRSPLLVLAAPTVVWRFAADNPHYWGPHFHYNAVLMPIVFAALIDGLRRPPLLRLALGRRRSGVVVGCVVVAVALLPWRSVGPGFWRVPPAVVQARAALRMIPDDATVAATTYVAAQLTGRCQVQLLRSSAPAGPPVDWVAIGDPGDFMSADQVRARVHELRSTGYQLAYDDNGLVLLRRFSGGASGPHTHQYRADRVGLQRPVHRPCRATGSVASGRPASHQPAGHRPQPPR